MSGQLHQSSLSRDKSFHCPPFVLIPQSQNFALIVLPIWKVSSFAPCCISRYHTLKRPRESSSKDLWLVSLFPTSLRLSCATVYFLYLPHVSWFMLHSSTYESRDRCWTNYLLRAWPQEDAEKLGLMILMYHLLVHSMHKIHEALPAGGIEGTGDVNGFDQHSWDNCGKSRGHNSQFLHSAGVMMWNIYKIQFRKNNSCVCTSLKQQFATMPVWERWFRRSWLEGNNKHFLLSTEGERERKIGLGPFGKNSFPLEWGGHSHKICQDCSV
jgi:hypothetical protein